jgi:hypothetical protein
MGALSSEAEKLGKLCMYKIHVSVNQIDPKYGNFNFLPRLAPPSSGIMPHTVMYYGVNDDYAPVYGRKDFVDIRKFSEEQTAQRPVWYFPETSYWVGMDLDVPLLLTDYLVARSSDMDWAEKAGIPGHIDFSSGQEMGSWLFDWTVALLANADYRGDPMIGLKLLGEDEKVWGPILDFQTRFIKGSQKNHGLLGMLSASTLLDEIPFFGESVHERVLFKTLQDKPLLAMQEAEQLLEAEKNEPSLDGVVHPELKALLQVTWIRIRHARLLRQAFTKDDGSAERLELVNEASQERLKAQEILTAMIPKNNRYPEALDFSHNDNPTSYQYGYAWPAAHLHFWKREEQVLVQGRFDAFFMNIYDIGRILF